jgi:hypothetical protein
MLLFFIIQYFLLLNKQQIIINFGGVAYLKSHIYPKFNLEVKYFSVKFSLFLKFSIKINIKKQVKTLFTSKISEN